MHVNKLIRNIQDIQNELVMKDSQLDYIYERLELLLSNVGREHKEEVRNILRILENM